MAGPPADEPASELSSFEKRRLRTPLPPFLDMVERAEVTPGQQERQRASGEHKLGRSPCRYEVVASCVVQGGASDYGPS